MAIPSQSIDPKKRSRITTFYSSDEDEDAADQMRQPLKSIKLSSGHAQTERQTRAREAKRLEPGRQELPIWQGKLSRRERRYSENWIRLTGLNPRIQAARLYYRQREITTL